MANEMCFGCGRENPCGLHLQCHLTDGGEAYEVSFTPQSCHQGYDGVIHGGILSTVLDELSADFLRARGKEGVTARLELRYRQPVHLGDSLTARAVLTKEKGPVHIVSSVMKNQRDEIVVEGEATIMTK